MTHRQFRRFSWASEVREAARSALFQEVLVACPSCGQPAWAKSLSDSARLVCGSCGLFRETGEGQACSPVFGPGEVRDSWFGARLWLQADVAGHLLWAANWQHLLLIQRYVASGTRSRAEFTQFGRAIGQQLPRWLVSGKNRDALLRTIARLQKLEA